MLAISLEWCYEFQIVIEHIQAHVSTSCLKLLKDATNNLVKRDKACITVQKESKTTGDYMQDTA